MFPQDVISLTSGTRAHGDVWEGVKGPFRSWSKDSASLQSPHKWFWKKVQQMSIANGGSLLVGFHGWTCVVDSWFPWMVFSVYMCG